MGDDADQFATGNDNAAFIEDADDDLLGGGGGGEEVTEFESAFPSIDTRNDVRTCIHFSTQDVADKPSECSPRRNHHRHLRLPIPTLRHRRR